MKNYLCGAAIGVFALLFAFGIPYLATRNQPAQSVFRGEDYEQEGYEDVKEGIPPELCGYEGNARAWYMRGYKKGFKELLKDDKKP